MLSAEQKELKKEICSDLLQCARSDLDLLKSVITCDETWLFTYDLGKQMNNLCTGRLRESFEVQGHLILSSVSQVLDGTVGFEWPDLTNCVDK